MILYLYALVDGLDSVNGVTGVAREPVTVIEVAGVGVAAGWLEHAPDLTREALHAQDQVVRALHGQARAVLPCRFGTAVRDVETAAQSMDIIRPDLAERFARVAGRDQMTIRALRDPQARESAASEAPSARSGEGESLEGPGARYLRARAATREVPGPLIPVLEAVGDLARATEVEPGRHAGLIGIVYHLIDRGAAGEYHRRLAVVASEEPGLTLRVSGPSPAYAFARR